MSRIVIRNYRNFQDLDMPLNRQNVIVGANRVGKSNLISAIRLAIDPNLSVESRKLNGNDFSDIEGRPAFDGRKIIVSLEFDLESVEERNAMIDLKALVAVSDSPLAKSEKNTFVEGVTVSTPLSSGKVDNDFGKARFTYEFYYGTPKAQKRKSTDLTQETVSDTEIDSNIVSHLPTQYTYIWYASVDYNAPLKDKLEREVNSRVLNAHLMMLTLRALRDTEDLISNWSRSPLKSLLEGLELEREFLEDVAKQIRDEVGKVAINEKVNHLMQAIDNRSADMIGSIFNIGPTLNAMSEDADSLLRAMQLFIDQNKINPRPIGYASLGALNILYLALLLEDMHRNKLNVGQQTILALEEPEAHVHPHVQRSLFKYFVDAAEKEKSASLIVTTHSPHIVSVSPITSIISLQDKVGAGTKCFWVNKDNFTHQEILDLQRYIDVTRGEIIFAKAIIFVEGITEKFILPVFARLLGIEFDHLGISVVSVEGADFEPYIKLASSHNLNIPFVVLTDRDHKSREDDKDEESDASEPGIERSMRLIRLIDPTAKELSLEQIARKGVFLGEGSTCEVELILKCHKQMIEAYEGLVVRQSTRNSFRSAIELAIAELANLSEEKGVKEVLKRIEKKGKGRYAQRLSALLQESNNPSLCPDYIRRCIRHAEALSLQAAGLSCLVRWND